MTYDEIYIGTARTVDELIEQLLRNNIPCGCCYRCRFCRT